MRQGHNHDDVLLLHRRSGRARLAQVKVTADSHEQDADDQRGGIALEEAFVCIGMGSMGRMGPICLRWPQPLRA